MNGVPPRRPRRAHPRCPTVHLDARSKSIRRRHPVQEWTNTPPAYPCRDLDEALLCRGVLQRTRVGKLVARISAQPLDDLPCLLLAAPHVARCRARFADPLVERGEV